MEWFGLEVGDWATWVASIAAVITLVLLVLSNISERRKTRRAEKSLHTVEQRIDRALEAITQYLEYQQHVIAEAETRALADGNPKGAGEEADRQPPPRHPARPPLSSHDAENSYQVDDPSRRPASQGRGRRKLGAGPRRVRLLPRWHWLWRSGSSAGKAEPTLSPSTPTVRRAARRPVAPTAEYERLERVQRILMGEVIGPAPRVRTTVPGHGSVRGGSESS